MSESAKRTLGFWERFFTRGPGLAIVIPYALIITVCVAVYALVIALAVRFVCLIRGRYIVFVHSDSPVWQDYIGANILPRLPPDTVLLNWSEHSKWSWKWVSFPVRVFRLYGGDADFNPIGLVGTAFRGVSTFRFWQPFKDLKHGNDKPLKDVETRFFECIAKTRPRHRLIDSP